MIRVVLTDEAYDAIASTLPKGAALWPMQREQGQCFIQGEAAVVDRIRAMRRPSESYRYSDDNAAKNRAAWKAVKIHAPTKTETQCKDVIRQRVKSCLLVRKLYENKGQA